jgi:hypothetical protein
MLGGGPGCAGGCHHRSEEWWRPQWSR